ncbi:MAG: helix-turn-helix domain-containing protein [Armatimonadetes bacterium]|nr:helix-turn-helix domain-containing protein [Armatimonadota bacterium]
MPRDQVITRDEYFEPGRLPLAVLRVSGHRPTAVHRHEFSELVVVFRGRGRHVTDSGNWPIRAGDVFVLHGDQAHGYENTDDLDLANILFSLDELPLPRVDLGALPGYHALFDLEPRYRSRDGFDSRLRLGPEPLRAVAALVDRLADELRSREPGSGFASLATFMLLVAELSRHYTSDPPPAAQPLLDLGRVVSYLEQHFDDEITLDSLAKMACLSRRSLTRAFRGAYGCSPIDHLIRLRVARAAVLLEDPRLSITEIAGRTGFGDGNYLARVFRRQMGCTPSAYRRMR